MGSVLMADGLGRHSAELIEALKDNVSIGFEPTALFCLEGVPSKIQKILRQKKPLGKVLVYQDYLIVNGRPLDGNITSIKNSGSIRIAQSMFESSLIPSEWAHILNHYFDAVFVPDKFLIDVYKNSGVTIPVFEIPLAVDLHKFYNMPLKINKNHPMVFGNLSTALPRKNQVKLIQAFHQAFGNSTDVKLKINSRASEEACTRAIKEEIRKLGATNIEFTEGPLKERTYLNVFQNIDCYVSLSLGEGFSIQPREAMALGIPSIITDNTGQSTICASGLVRTVPSANTRPAFYQLYQNYHGVCYDCTLEDVTCALRDVYENYDHYLQQGSAAREWSRKCSFDQLKPLYLGLIKPKRIILGTINKITPDCLFTNSKELCEKFNKLLGIPFEDHREI
ncbi:MAG: glycosyltransferase family 4 protein [Rhabdochlamydiaceae bacterium]|jgi:glycosyltransferase involved in cell wall biosynthesis